METLEPVPKINKTYWFYADDRVKANTEYKAKVLNIYPYKECTTKYVYKYDDFVESVISIPLMDLWIEEKLELFWILADKTDYIIELYIPDLCPQNVYIARTLDGGWHSFETASSKQFGFLDVSGKNHELLQQK